MSDVLCPNDGWVFKYGDYEGREPVYSESEDKRTVIASIEDSDGKVRFISERMPKDFDAYVYIVNEDGISLAEYNKFVQNLKATSPPSYFKTFEVYVEDCNGVTATYGLRDIAIGKENTVDLAALVRGKDFNDSYIVKAGYHFSGPKQSIRFRFILSYASFTYMENPLYCTPQDVADFLNLMDNRNQPLRISETTVPSYNTLARRIKEAEDYVETQTRQAFVERRVEGEVRNADSAWPGTYGYYGILATSGYDMGAQTFYKGCPVKLTHTNVLPIDYSKGDLVEIRRFGSYWTIVDESMLWEDGPKGIIYVKSLFFQKDASVRVTYRYGRGPIPADIRQAVIMKTALLYYQTDFLRGGLPQSPEWLADRQATMSAWTWTLKDLLRGYTSAVAIGGI